MKKRRLQAYAAAALGFVLCYLWGFAAGRGGLVAARQAMEALERDALYGAQAQALDRAAVQGMLDTLNDPMAAYLTPELMDVFSNQLSSGRTVGLGMETARMGQGYYVCAVMENSPAQLGGIARGDIIVAIDGLRVDAGAVWSAYAEGQKVELGVSRNGIVRTQTLFTAWIDPFPDVEHRWLNEQTGYVRIRSFTQDGMEKLTLEALGVYLERGDAILDLRHNPGGRLDAAIAIASAFVPKGETVLTLYEANDKREIYRSRDGSLCGGRLMVLVDSKSASASEVLAGILRDSGAAVLIGQPTFGKGTVQRVTALKNGAGMRYTIAEYGLPCGARIDGVGIVPDIVMAASEVPGFALAHTQDEMLQTALSNVAPIPVP